VGEVIDASINVYLRNLGGLLLIAAAVIVPLTAIIFVLDVLSLQEASPLDQNAALYQVGDSLRYLDEGRFVLYQVIGAIVGVVAYLLVIGATFRAVSEAYLGRPVDVRASLGFAARRAPSLLWLGILLVIGIGLGFLFLIVPGIWLLVAWSVAVPALMVEGMRGNKAIRRSFNLTRPSWFRTAGALIVGFIFIALIGFLLSLASASFDGLADDHLYLWAALVDALNAVWFIISSPLQAAIVTVIYYDLRVRNEGYDVQLMAEQLDRPDDAGTTAPAPSAPVAPAAPGAPGPEPDVSGSVPPPAAGESPQR
jgi:hypothetical protein